MVYFSEETCVMCGAPIPEGRQVCPLCEYRVLEETEHRMNNTPPVPSRYPAKPRRSLLRCLKTLGKRGMYAD